MYSSLDSSIWKKNTRRKFINCGSVLQGKEGPGRVSEMDPVSSELSVAGKDGVGDGANCQIMSHWILSDGRTSDLLRSHVGLFG